MCITCRSIKYPHIQLRNLTVSCENFFGERLELTDIWRWFHGRKICLHTDEGGLEIRNLQLFNEALVLKLMWEMASNSDKLWAQIMKAKYCPMGGFWGVDSKRDASQLWRNMQDLKPFFRASIGWHIGDGKKIPAIGQPWYRHWEPKRPRSHMERDLRVVDLFDHDTR